MTCEHKRLKSVNCVIYCADCGVRMEGATPHLPAAQAPSPQGEGKEKLKRARKKKEGQE